MSIASSSIWIAPTVEPGVRSKARGASVDGTIPMPVGSFWSPASSSSDSSTPYAVWYSRRLRWRIVCRLGRIAGSSTQPVELELFQLVRFPEELLFEIGHDRMLPDALDPLLV